MRSILAAAALGLSFACASTGAVSSGGAVAGTEGGSCAPATASKGAVIHASPDGTSEAVATLSSQSRVCADSGVVGFGFRHVKLPDGKEGYVAESDLI